jgi:beta-glucanase (GH16 family)
LARTGENLLHSNRFARVAAATCLLPALTSGIAAASVVSDNPSAWNLTFNDDFNGSSLDATKWANRLPGPRNSAINTPDAVSVGGGVLNITTYTDNGTHYTGMIGSQNKFEQTYGYFEARMKFHTSPGQWSAFWLTSPVYDTGVGNPGLYGTETDIVEHRAVNSNDNDIRNRYVSAVHWDGYGADHKQVANTYSGLTGMGNDSWHTFGLLWSPAGYSFYYDDTLLWTVTDAISARPEYMILSSEVRNANWAGHIPAEGYGSLATSVTNMQVDYVHVYQSVPEPGGVTAALLCGAAVVLRRRRGGACR